MTVSNQLDMALSTINNYQKSLKSYSWILESLAHYKLSDEYLEICVKNWRLNSEAV